MGDRARPSQLRCRREGDHSSGFRRVGELKDVLEENHLVEFEKASENDPAKLGKLESAKGTAKHIRIRFSYQLAVGRQPRFSNCSTFVENRG
jgi:hypothetical protein